MQVSRRGFLRGAAVVAVAPLVPTITMGSAPAVWAVGESVAVGAGIITTGSIPRLLQEGVHKLMTEQYANYPSEYTKIFRPSSRATVLELPNFPSPVSQNAGFAR